MTTRQRDGLMCRAVRRSDTVATMSNFGTGDEEANRTRFETPPPPPPPVEPETTTARFASLQWASTCSGEGGSPRQNPPRCDCSTLGLEDR